MDEPIYRNYYALYGALIYINCYAF